MAKQDANESENISLAGGWKIETETESASTTSDVDVVVQREEKPIRGQLSNISLVLLGLAGGIYLIYTVVWMSWANAQSVQNAQLAEASGTLGAILQQIAFWFAPVAPVLWFLTVLVLGRGGAKHVSLWLVLGIILLVPLPMFGGM